MNYHGVKPVTPSDKKMAKKHLQSTKSLLLSKITDHQQAKAAASDPQSKSYNQSHLDSHKKDLTDVNQSLSTLSGLAGYVSKKKIGASAIASKAKYSA